MKKVFVILLGLVCVGLGGGLLQKTQYAYATNSTEEEAINVVNETLEDIDLSNLENYESDYSELEGFKGKSARLFRKRLQIFAKSTYCHNSHN